MHIPDVGFLNPDHHGVTGMCLAPRLLQLLKCPTCFGPSLCVPQSAPEAEESYRLLPSLFQISHHRPRPIILFLIESQTNLEAYFI